MGITKTRAASLAHEAVQIMERGWYEAGGQRVEIGVALEEARRQTKGYEPGQTPQVTPPTDRDGQIEVHNETTLDAAERLFDEGLRPVALNFASAKNAGGGFLNGARAQEEFLCRASGLWKCIGGHDFYTLHRNMGGAFYSDYALYSPGVPVFRGPDEELLSQPWPLAFITCAAPNAKAMSQHQPGVDLSAQIESGFETRIRKVLSIALDNAHDALVLGAWGCGAFGNDTRRVAPIFGRVLRAEFAGAFARVAFAVLDASQDEKFIGPFKREFGR